MLSIGKILFDKPFRWIFDSKRSAVHGSSDPIRSVVSFSLGRLINPPFFSFKESGLANLFMICLTRSLVIPYSWPTDSNVLGLDPAHP